MNKIDTNPIVSTSKWTRLYGSSILEPDIYTSREDFDAYVAKEQYAREKEQYAREKAEERRCKNLKAKMEEVICRSFSGEELTKIQTYKEAIFGYLKDNAKYGIENFPSTLENYIAIYYKDLAGKPVTTSEYGFVQLNSRTTNNTITHKLNRRYFICDGILESVAREIEMDKEEIIALIDRDNMGKSLPNLDIFKDKVIKSLTLKRDDDSFVPSVSDFVTAISTIKQLRGNPKMMGLTYDGMILRTEGKLPPLRRH